MHAQTSPIQPPTATTNTTTLIFTHIEVWLTPFPTVQLFHYGNVILNPQKGPNALVENMETLQTTPTHPPTGAVEAQGQHTTQQEGSRGLH